MERYNYEQDESYIQRLREYIEKLEEENKKLKAELEFYKKQYKHSMGEDS